MCIGASNESFRSANTIANFLFLCLGSLRVGQSGLGEGVGGEAEGIQAPPVVFVEKAGEAAGLHWSDIDTKNRTLLVRRQLSRGREGKTKTRKRRSVDLSQVLLSELTILKKQRQAEYLARGKNEIPDHILLGTGVLVKDEDGTYHRTEGRPWDMNNWRNRVYWKACDKAQIRRRRLHDTRHTFASLLLNNGESLKYVSSQLGHASIRMTADVYGHLEIGSNRAAMDRLPTLKSSTKSSSQNAANS
jgi:integrase